MATIALVQPLKYADYSTSADVVGLYEGNPAFGFLSHFLKSKGHEVVVCDCNQHEDYIGRFVECAPQVAGVRFDHLYEMMHEARGNSPAKEVQARLTEEAQVTALLLGSMYAS